MSPPWMPLYIADYLADTAHLSAAESGAYLHLIMHYWQKGGLPQDEKHLARIARLTPSEWAEHCSSIASFFQSGWKHDRIDRELASAQEKYEKRANAGRRGGNAKATAKQSSSNATAALYQPQPHPSTKEIADSAREPASNEVSKEEEGELFAVAGKVLSSSPNLFVMAEPMKWKAAGMDWLLDVIPAVRTTSQHCQPGSVKSWKYYSQSVADWHAKRITPMPIGNVNGRTQNAPRRTTADLAREVAEQFKRAESERGDGGNLPAAVQFSRAG